ncbi:MAG: hypothetical protein KF795_22970 [Labilithrix sp.]|nr:hypothetical protein [Labilithrix sp.]
MVGLLLAACDPSSDAVEEGGANANDRSDGNAEGDRLESGAMAVSPTGGYIVARRNTTTLIVDVRGERVTELDLVGERFVFSKTRDVVYAVLANLKGVVAIDLATAEELWHTQPAFTSSAGAFLARVTADDTTLLVADYDRVFAIDPASGDVRSATPSVGVRPVDLELLPGDRHALVVGSTTWADGGPHTPVSLVGVTDAKVTTVDVPNCAAPISILPDGSRALLSPTFCTADAEARAKGWQNPDPVSVIDVDASAGALSFVKNLPGFGPVSLLADGRAVAYLDTTRMDPSMFDDASQIPGPSADRYHLMTIEPRSMAFELDPIGKQLPRFAPGKDGKSLLVDASVVVVRNEVSATVTIDARGKITAEVKGAFGDTSGSLFGVFDLQTKKYVPFAGPAASLDRFVQLGDGSQVFTLKETAVGGDLFAIDVAGRTSVDLGRSLRDIGILPDGRTLVLRVRLDLDAERHAREEFCFSKDARTCDATIRYRSRTPQARD